MLDQIRQNVSRCLFFSLLIISIVACAPLIGAYSQKTYEFATSLKVESLALMAKGGDPFVDHKHDIEKLNLELQKAYEFVKGDPKNGISAKMWKKLINPEGNLIGKFFVRWEEYGSYASRNFVLTEQIKNVTQAFDEIICLEANKKSVTACDIYKD